MTTLIAYQGDTMLKKSVLALLAIAGLGALATMVLKHLAES